MTEVLLSGRSTGAAGAHYRRIFDSRSAEQLHRLALIKRFLERLGGDDEFRLELNAVLVNGESTAAFSELKGLGLDIDGLRPLLGPLDPEVHAEGVASGRFALAAEWRTYVAEMLAHREFVKQSGSCGEVNPLFDQWRARQIRRCEGELGPSGGGIVHPVIAFELSDGCSVGCWFCGISASKFKGSWPYAGNEAVWRGVLAETRDFFGAAAESGFCYWATDPIDNPDYARFIEDYYHVVGSLPQTTTAAALRDVPLTRSILSLFDKYRCITNRFSILNRRILRQVHETFTPQELMGVELVLQNREGNVEKASAGRVRSRAAARGEVTPESNSATIACVTGFLVNMVLGRVQLVTPTRSSDRWPDGYWVVAERRFHDVAGYREALRDLASQHVTDRLRPLDPLRLREDVTLGRSAGGLTLSDRGAIHTMDLPFLDSLEVLLTRGDLTAGDALCRLVGEGADFFQASMALNDLFAAGLLDEDPQNRSRRAVEHAVDPV